MHVAREAAETLWLAASCVGRMYTVHLVAQRVSDCRRLQLAMRCTLETAPEQGSTGEHRESSHSAQNE